MPPAMIPSYFFVLTDVLPSFQGIHLVVLCVSRRRMSFQHENSIRSGAENEAVITHVIMKRKDCIAPLTSKDIEH